MLENTNGYLHELFFTTSIIALVLYLPLMFLKNCSEMILFTRKTGRNGTFYRTNKNVEGKKVLNWQCNILKNLSGNLIILVRYPI